MKDVLTKLKLIFIPFIVIAILFISVYTFLDWLLIIKYQALVLSDEWVVYFLPCIVSTIIVFGILAPRINLLKDYVKGRNSLLFFIKFMSIAILCAPVIFFQLYIQTITGKLTQLNYISEINNAKPTKYYTVSKFYASKDGIGSCYSTWQSRGNEYPNTIHVYITIPLFNEAKDTSSTENICGWLLDDQFNKTLAIPEKLGSDTVKRAFEKFYSESVNSFNKNPIPQFIYLERTTTTDIRYSDYIYGIKRSSQYVNGNSTILLYPINEPFESRTDNDFEGIFISVFVGLCILVIILTLVDFDMTKLENYEATKKFPRRPFI